MTKRGFWKLKHALWYLLAKLCVQHGNKWAYDSDDLESIVLIDNLYGGQYDIHGADRLVNGHGSTRF